MARAPRSYLVLSNLTKSANVAALLRSADAFGVHAAVVVGRRKIPPSAAVGMAKYVERVPCTTMAEAQAYLRAQGCRILGVEVDADATPIEQHPFAGDTAFVLGNEGEGLIAAQRAMCDGYVRIPQFGHACSLNVNVAGAIVLHHFATWAGYAERPITGHKFVPATGHARVPDHVRQHNRLPPEIRAYPSEDGAGEVSQR